MKPGLAAAFLLAFSFQLVALPLYRIGSACPDFILILIAYVAAFERPLRAHGLAAAAGLAVDLISADPLGCRTFGYLATTSISIAAARAGWAEDALPRALLLATGTLAAGAIRVLFLRLETEFPLALALETASGMAVYNAILGLAVFRLLDPLRQRLVAPSRRFPA